MRYENACLGNTKVSEKLAQVLLIKTRGWVWK